ncbi:hypothetical protein [Streptomyces physcomitrii]|uniref:Uncharacterized protein n=1 Tax=Streptomyces physcomitrii TaxID=2724184 RepID=A0ABX1H5W1_9ACTN|nr:hypothetical protein [Streptomyces physcomitrii]NKI42406.1 hypothetical protein [Streptomyces physcomitrii]
MVDSVKDLKAFKDIGDLRSARLWREADLRGGDLGLHKLKESLDEVDSSLRFDVVVKGHLDTFQTQTNIWKGTTIFATAADAADKGELFGLVGAPDGLYELTGVKDATTTGNG